MTKNNHLSNWIINAQFNMFVISDVICWSESSMKKQIMERVLA